MGGSITVGEKAGALFAGQMTPRGTQNAAEVPQAPDQKKEAVESSSGSRGDTEKETPRFEPIDFKNRYQVKMDTETGRIFTDIVDPATDSVVGRIPSYFKANDELNPEAEAIEVGPRKVTV